MADDNFFENENANDSAQANVAPSKASGDSGDIDAMSTDLEKGRRSRRFTQTLTGARESIRLMRRKEAIKGYTRTELGGLIAGPLLALIFCFVPISEEYPKAQLMVGMTVWIVVWWLCLVVPLAITALIPIIMFPLLQISTAKAITSVYFNSISWLFIGAFIVDFGIEKVELHKRIALEIILKMGTSPRMLMLSMMLVCVILSAFCSNTSTTLMLVPFVLGIMEKAKAEVIDEGRPEDVPKVEEFGRGLLIGVAWSASIGGSATLIGTTGPAILAAYYSEKYPQAPVPIDFGTWSAFAVGISIVLFIIAYAIMAIFYCNSALKKMDKGHMVAELKAMGPFRQDEMVVAAAQIFQIVFWFLNGVVLVQFVGECTGAEASDRSACYSAGGTWSSRFVSYDSGVACLAAASLFLIPSKDRPGERVLDWEYVSGKMPWDVLFLLGGGFAISRGFLDSGLSIVVAEALASMRGIPLAAAIYVIILIVIFLTEVTSNTATASIMVPVLASAAEGLGVNPLALLLPGVYATGCAFMLPIATPPNAIVYATHKLQFTSMVGGGFVLNIIASCIILLFTMTVGKHLFGGGTWLLPEDDL